MSARRTFRARIENPGGGGAFVRIPFDVEQAFGKKRFPVLASIDGQPYRGTLVRMGEPCHVLIVVKEIRARIGKDFGEEVEISLEEDLLPRTVEVPPDLQQVLEQESAARQAFESLSYSRRREHVLAILEAKRPQTRRARIARTIQSLREKGGS